MRLERELLFERERFLVPAAYLISKMMITPQNARTMRLTA